MKHVLRAAQTEYSKLEKPLTDAEVGGWMWRGRGQWLLGFWGKGEGGVPSGGKGKEKTFNPYPFPFSQNPIPN
jgi:hypothetical protein